MSYSLTFHCLALDEIEVVSSAQDPRAETPHQALQVAVVHVENILVHDLQESSLPIDGKREKTDDRTL